MKINITCLKHSIGEQAFDALYAYRQSLNPKYQSDIEITINGAYDPADFNVLYTYMPDRLEPDLDKYNLVLVCNGGEPLLVAQPTMIEWLKNPNVYLITNSYLDTDHPLYNRVVWFPHHWMTCRDYWTRHFYPQYYENTQRDGQVKNGRIVGINGANRAWRHHFFQLVSEQIPNIPLLSNIHAEVSRVFDSQWESTEDLIFRDWLNNKYQDQFNLQPFRSKDYYRNSVNIGVDGKFGSIPPGYFIMPEYFEYSCVVYPETGWQNNELNITEKSLKCFYAGSLPFPISGAGVNCLYNELGFNTAWNLLPNELQNFDSILDHIDRYKSAVKALAWLNQHPEVFLSAECQSMINHNRINMLTCASETRGIQRLSQLIDLQQN